MLTATKEYALSILRKGKGTLPPTIHTSTIASLIREGLAVPLVRGRYGITEMGKAALAHHRRNLYQDWRETLSTIKTHRRQR